jgi:dihydrofolate reductase
MLDGSFEQDCGRIGGPRDPNEHMSRRLRYGVAATLDGFIAGPKGEYDWIITDPSIDFAAMYRQYDTAVMGRKTYEIVVAAGDEASMGGLDVVVFSRTLPPVTKPGLRLVNDDPRTVVAELKAKPGRDIWLFGGGELCRTLLDAGLVDTIEVAVMPVLLTVGVPLLAPGGLARLVLSDHRILRETGIVLLSYRLERVEGTGPRIGYVKAEARATKTRPRGGRRSGAE